MHSMTFEEMHEIVSERAPKRMKVLRELFNYTQEYMAESMKIGQTSYGNLERGSTAISPRHIASFCAALNITTVEFFDFDLTAIMKRKKLKV